MCCDFKSRKVTIQFLIKNFFAWILYGFTMDLNMEVDPKFRFLNQNSFRFWILNPFFLDSFISDLAGVHSQVELKFTWKLNWILLKSQFDVKLTFYWLKISRLILSWIQVKFSAISWIVGTFVACLLADEHCCLICIMTLQYNDLSLKTNKLCFSKVHIQLIWIATALAPLHWYT